MQVTTVGAPNKLFQQPHTATCVVCQQQRTIRSQQTMCLQAWWTHHCYQRTAVATAEKATDDSPYAYSAGWVQTARTNAQTTQAEARHRQSGIWARAMVCFCVATIPFRLAQVRMKHWFGTLGAETDWRRNGDT